MPLFGRFCVKSLNYGRFFSSQLVVFCLFSAMSFAVVWRLYYIGVPFYEC